MLTEIPSQSCSVRLFNDKKNVQIYGMWKDYNTTCVCTHTQNIEYGWSQLYTYRYNHFWMLELEIILFSLYFSGFL